MYQPKQLYLSHSEAALKQFSASKRLPESPKPQRPSLHLLNKTPQSIDHNIPCLSSREIKDAKFIRQLKSIGQKQSERIKVIQENMKKTAQANTIGPDAATASNYFNKSTEKPASLKTTDVSFLMEQSKMRRTTSQAFVVRKNNITPRRQRQMQTSCQLTTGNEAQDEYLKLALNLQNIGKSILHLPGTISDLKGISDEYFSTLDKIGGIKDEKVFADYVNQQSDHLSPIAKNLNEYYLKNRELNNETSKTQRNLVSLHKKDFEEIRQRLTKIPSVNIMPKRIKFVSRQVMGQHGEQAFNIKSQRLNLQEKSRQEEDFNQATQNQRKRSLIKSINDQTELLTTPAIFKQKESEPDHDWLKTALAESKKDGSNLGKPSSRLDATLLIKWFADTMALVSTEDSLTNHQKLSYSQIVHNIAIKELIRQLSVTCIERGILCKQIFRSYIQLIDFIHLENISQRLTLSKQYAKKFEDHIKNSHDIKMQMEVEIRDLKQDVQKLQYQLDLSKTREDALKNNNDKLTKLAYRNQMLLTKEKDTVDILSQQNRSYEAKLNQVQESLDHSRPKDVQLDKDIQTMKNLFKKHTATREALSSMESNILGNNLVLPDHINKDQLIKEIHVGTEMHDFEDYLEEKFGPLRIEVGINNVPQMVEQSLSTFKLGKIGRTKTRACQVEPELMMTGLQLRLEQRHSIKMPLQLSELAPRGHSQPNLRTFRALRFKVKPARCYSVGGFKAVFFDDKKQLKILMKQFGQDLPKIKQYSPDLFKAMQKHMDQTKQGFSRTQVNEIRLGFRQFMKQLKKRNQFDFAFRQVSQQPSVVVSATASPHGSEKNAEGTTDDDLQKTAELKQYDQLKVTIQRSNTKHKQEPTGRSLLKAALKKRIVVQERDMMPQKTLIRIINQVYLHKAQEIVKKKESKFTASDKKVLEKRSRSRDYHSPQRGPSKLLIDHKTDTPDKGQDASEVKLLDQILDIMVTKYGMRNIAERKLTTMIYALLILKNKSPRVRLFGRFLGVYSEKENLAPQDLRTYLKTINQLFKMVLNFQIVETDENPIIPATRAYDMFRQLFSNKLSASAMKFCLKQLSQMKRVYQVKQAVTNVDKTTQLFMQKFTESVGLDVFCEFVIDTKKKLVDEKIQNLKDIFIAADMNGNGLLDFSELKILHALLSTSDDRKSMDTLKKAYEEFAEWFPIKDDRQNEEPVGNQDDHKDDKSLEGSKNHLDQEQSIEAPEMESGLTLERFQQMCLKYKLYSIRVQNHFVNDQNLKYMGKRHILSIQSQRLLEAKFYELKGSLNDVKERLLKIIDGFDRQSDEEKQEHIDMVNCMTECVSNPVNPKVAFLTFRIVEETVKRAYLKDQVTEMMPLNVKKFNQQLQKQCKPKESGYSVRFTGDKQEGPKSELKQQEELQK